jgi:hypothetical protein
MGMISWLIEATDWQHPEYKNNQRACSEVD